MLSVDAAKRASPQCSLHGLRGVRLGDRCLARHGSLAIRHITRDTIDADDGALRVTSEVREQY